MIKNFKLDIVIIFVFCNCTLHAQESIKTRYNFQFYSGYNRTVLNESTSEKVFYHSIIIQPHKLNGFLGVRVGFVRESSNGLYADTSEEQFYYIHPQIYYQGKYFGVVPGIIFIKPIDCEGPENLVLPTISIRAGKMKKMFLSLDFLHEISFGLLCMNINYLFSDDVSKIMICAFRGSEYTGIGCEMNFKMLYKFYVAMRGTVNLENGFKGIQMGIGYVR